MNWYKKAGFATDSYKDLLKNSPDIMSKLSPEDRAKIQQSEDIKEILRVIEKAHHIKL